MISVLAIGNIAPFILLKTNKAAVIHGSEIFNSLNKLTVQCSYFKLSIANPKKEMSAQNTQIWDYKIQILSWKSFQVSLKV